MKAMGRGSVTAALPPLKELTAIIFLWIWVQAWFRTGVSISPVLVFSGWGMARVAMSLTASGAFHGALRLSSIKVRRCSRFRHV